MRQMLLHTEAFEHRCLSTQKHFSQRRFDIYTPIHTEAFRHRLFFRESQKPWHRESYTNRSFYTHTSFSTEKLLSTGAFTHRRLYTQKLVHTEGFTHRSFYTEKPLHTDAFPQKNRFHRAALTHCKKLQFYVGFWRSAIISCERVASGVGKPQFLTLDNHFTWKGCAWPCKIAILHKFYFAWNGCAWRFKMDKVAILHQFLNVCIWR